MRFSDIARGESFDSLSLSLSKGELAQDRLVEPRASLSASFDELRTSVYTKLCAA